MLCAPYDLDVILTLFLVGTKLKGMCWGILKGLGLSAVVGVLAPGAGLITGLLQVFRGALNTPFYIGNSWFDDKEWDEKSREWYNYHLDVEVEEVLGESEEDHIAKIEQTIREEESSRNQPTSKQVLDGEAKKTKEVKETRLYELLEADVAATTTEIKKRYYIQARKYHPDKNKGNIQAKEKFQKIGEAYQILSDPKLRKQYDLFGKDGVQSGTNKFDPVIMFSFIFGSEKFGDLIGELYYSMLITAASSTGGDEENDNEFAEIERIFFSDRKSSEVLAYKQKRREVQCAANLASRIDLLLSLDEDQISEFQRTTVLEAEEFSQDSLGQVLLGFVGYMYVQESKSYLSSLPLATSSTKVLFNFPWHMVRVFHGFYLQFLYYWTISRLVWKMLVTFLGSRWKRKGKEKASTEEGSSPGSKKEGEQPEEELEELQEMLWKFKDLGLEYVWNSSILDVEVTLKKAIRKLLKDKSVSKASRQHRARWIHQVGQIYLQKGAYSMRMPRETILTALQKKFKDVFGEVGGQVKQTDKSKPFTRENLKELKVSELKALLQHLAGEKVVNFSGFIDKSELVEAILERQSSKYQ